MIIQTTMFSIRCRNNKKNSTWKIKTTFLFPQVEPETKTCIAACWRRIKLAPLNTRPTLSLPFGICFIILMRLRVAAVVQGARWINYLMSLLVKQSINQSIRTGLNYKVNSSSINLSLSLISLRRTAEKLKKHACIHQPTPS